LRHATKSRFFVNCSSYVDTYKGSYYANPQYDVPTEDQELITKYPHDYLPNLWPTEDLPELSVAFKTLGGLMVSVGAHVARHCDKYVKSKLPNYKDGLLENVVRNSRIAKARLLHYFEIDVEGERSRDSWCNWHNDHSALTALCSSRYVAHGDSTLTEINCPDPAAGLYARTRTGKEFKIPIPRDCLAFQIGESSQVLTGGVLRATPHAVQAPTYPESKTVTRDTFAVFMQPNHDMDMAPPAGVAPEDVAVGQWRPGQSYGQFSKITIENYYSDD
jgi:isopenicillin N synthase-like dioxygenase